MVIDSMELQEFELQKALKAYTNIARFGHKDESEYVLDGIRAWSDFDGYTVRLYNNEVSLTVYFHSQHKLEYKNKLALEDFLIKIKKISKMK